MAHLWVTHRTIIYEKQAQNVLDQYTDPHDRFHDQIMGIEWLLSRSPNVGVPAQKDEPTQFVLLVSKGDKLAQTNDIWLLYSYDDGIVTVHGINVINGQ